MQKAKKKFNFATSLPKYLKAMAIGEDVTVDFKYYSETQVRRCCVFLKKQGFVYEATIKDIINGIKVTRIA